MSLSHRQNRVFTEYRETRCHIVSVFSLDFQSENVGITPASSFNWLYFKLEVTDSSFPLLWLLLGRLVSQTPAAIRANLISPSPHAQSLSTAHYPPQYDLGWVSDWAMPCFPPSSKTNACTHAHTHTTPGPSLNSCHDNVQYPFIPKHIADFLKIMCVVFFSQTPLQTTTAFRANPRTLQGKTVEL